MSRAVTLGNGHMLVGIDDHACVRDIYYPYVGLENHVSGASGSYTHRIGVYVDGELSWLDDGSWHIEATTAQGTAVGVYTATHEHFGVRITLRDVLYNELNIFLRQVSVYNDRDHKRVVKVFFSHQFRISEDIRGGTGFYDPRVHAIIHYKGPHTFLMNALVGADTPFDDYTVGLFDIEGHKGSHMDAEDGELSKNAIEHGSVDSVMGVTLTVSPNTDAEFYYWLTAGSSIKKVHELNQYVIDETPECIHRSAESYWAAWIYKSQCNMDGLCNFKSVEPELEELFHRSLVTMRAHTDNNGAIIASSDSDMLNGGRDTYSYVWPRDAAYAALAFDHAGYGYITQNFYRFCADVLEPEGYLMHKYCSDGSLGSSWHGWMQRGEMRLPIQLDETATVIFALGRHFESTRDLEFVESLYNDFIEKAADFLCTYIDQNTGLPKDTYDLWEEKFGSSTYTAASAYGALSAAARFARMLGKNKVDKQYQKAAAGIKQAILDHLYDEDLGMFVKHVRHTEDGLEYDRTIDMSSFHGVHTFDVLPPHDDRLRTSFNTINERLLVKTDLGGYMRYEEDNYYRTGYDASPNPWCVTTLWAAQYLIKVARSTDELQHAKALLWWVHARAHKTGILPEQVHPVTGANIFTAPLVWSHAEYVNTLFAYTKRAQELPDIHVISDKKSTEMAPATQQ